MDYSIESMYASQAHIEIGDLLNLAFISNSMLAVKDYIISLKVTRTNDFHVNFSLKLFRSEKRKKKCDEINLK